MSLIERIKQSLKWSHLRSVRIEEVESGSVRVLQRIVRRLSLYLCHVMPTNAIHYSSTTWTITFGGCRIDVFDLVCSVAATHSFRNSSWLSPGYLLTYTNIDLFIIMIDWLKPTINVWHIDESENHDRRSITRVLIFS